MPSQILDLGGGRKTSSANLRWGLTCGARARGAGQVAEDLRRLRAEVAEDLRRLRRYTGRKGNETAGAAGACGGRGAQDILV